MADIFTKRKRSQIMASISGKETKPEISVRSFLFRQGFRFRKNVKTLIGKPDIVLPKHQTINFIHGCFWHGHNCKRGTKPTSNIEFWNSKIQGNIDRDKKTTSQLKKIGWRVITIWDCELKNKERFDSSMKKLNGKLNAK
ncbi:very short patch repair endonuclease [Candidatus Pollutiaquabacter sp.]|uniref:very short patch repair endonuclease n=1 Tax=Candidatus Pollutiaquabacter sp. TaxID=3416354 RepID=UPI003C9CD53E|nr:DNA mismatch endonuclease Vsr [Bacteroidota bacterium]